MSVFVAHRSILLQLNRRDYNLALLSLLFTVLSSLHSFLKRCMQCRRGQAMKILSVRPSVCLSNAWFVTKWKKDRSRFLYHTGASEGGMVRDAPWRKLGGTLWW